MDVRMECIVLKNVLKLDEIAHSSPVVAPWNPTSLHGPKHTVSLWKKRPSAMV